MSTGHPQSHEVPVEVLPPVPKDYPVFPPVPESGDSLGTFYHPASGVVILGIDWFVFGTDLVTGFVATPVMCVVAFLMSFILIYGIQTKWAKNTRRAALGKAFAGAFLVGLPFPITGTILGAAILVLSGLPHHPVELLKNVVKRGTVR